MFVDVELSMTRNESRVYHSAPWWRVVSDLTFFLNFDVEFGDLCCCDKVLKVANEAPSASSRVT